MVVLQRSNLGYKENYYKVLKRFEFKNCIVWIAYFIIVMKCYYIILMFRGLPKDDEHHFSQIKRETSTFEKAAKFVFV